MEKAQLVSKVRAALQAGVDNKRKWASFCQIHAVESLKAEVQDEAFLITFLEALESGGIPDLEGELPAELQDAWGGGGKWGGAGGAWGGKGGDSWGGKGCGGGAPRNNQGKIFVGGLPRTVTEATLTGYMSQFGTVKQVLFKYADDGLCKGFAFVIFEDPAVAAQVVQASQAGSTTFEGKWIDCKEIDESMDGKGKGKGKGKFGKDKGWGKGQMALGWDGGKGYGKGGGWGGDWDPSKRQRTDEYGSWSAGGGWGKGGGKDFGGKKGGGKADPPEKIFLGGLPRTVTDETVMATFSQYGPIARVDLKYDEMGTPKGFGFVYFQDAATAQSVVAMGGITIDGRQITVAASGANKGKGGGKW